MNSLSGVRSSPIVRVPQKCRLRNSIQPAAAIPGKVKRLHSNIADDRLAAMEFRAFLSSPAQGVVGVDDKGKIQLVNQRAEEMFGYAHGSLLGKPIDVLIPERVREIHVEEVGRYLEKARPRPMGMGIDLRGKRSDGAEFPLEISLNPVDVGQQTLILALVSDISERIEIERHARRAQKMEAVARFAAGIADEMEAFLSVLSGNEGSAEVITSAVDHAVLLIHKLRMISGTQSAELEWFDVNRLLGEMHESLSAMAGDRIEVEFRLGPDLGELLADRRQVEYVVMSLAQNACDAMPERGRITIETKSVELDEDDAGWFMAVSPGPHISITVADTGKWLVDEEERFLDPFACTKAVAEATGLRLTTVYGIVKNAGGNIRLPSALNQGAVFGVVFPRIGSINDGS